MLHLRLFGTPRIERDGAIIPLRRTRPLALLAYLAVEARPNDRDALLALLWPEFDDASARNNLRRELSLLKSTIGVEALVADRRHVRWNPAVDVQVDVAAFRSLVTAALPAVPGAGDHAARIAQLTEAASLYTAEFLDGFVLPDSRAFEEWQFFQRESLHQLYGQTLEQLVQSHLAVGATVEALPHARRWVALDPLHEPAQRMLMRLYAWLGQLAAAQRQFQECARLLHDELGVEPEQETQALHEAIRSRRLEPPRRPTPHPRAAPPTAPAATPPAAPLSPPTLFVGRDRELEQVTQLLIGDPGPRLVTLTGPGGIGKTRLALEAAAGFADVFPDGVRVVQLAGLTAPDLLPQTVAEALGVDALPDRPLPAALADHLCDRQLLLVLDNCEHLVEACAHLAEALLAACPQVRILATSREVLGIAAEVILPVPALELPDAARLAPAPALERFEAVRLFVARARAALPSFALTDENAAAVVQICHRLDGIPLAIELAAARVRLLRVEHIAARLGDRFTLLTSGSRTALPRHQTLRGLIDWSYELIAEPERDLLRRLAVFVGGWSLEAAEAVGGPGALDLLGQLVNKSLVVVDHQAVGETRYRLLETIRQYAGERLAEVQGEPAARARHLAHFLDLAERAEPELRGPAQAAWLDRLELEHGNLRAAFEWALATDVGASLRLPALLLWFWHIRGHRHEGSSWLDRALAQADRPAEQPPALVAARARALYAAGLLAQLQSHAGQAARLFEACLALRGHAEVDRHVVAAGLVGLGGLLLDDGEHAQAQRHLEEALALFRADGDTFGITGSLDGAGRAALLAGAYDRARALWQERLALAETIGDQDGTADARAHLGTAAFWQGDQRAAVELFEQSLASFRANGNRWGVSFTSISLGEAQHAAGDSAAAAELLAAALELGEELRDDTIIAAARFELGRLAQSQGDDALAAGHYQEALALMRRRGNAFAIGAALCALGELACDTGDLQTAEHRFDEALALARDAGDRMTHATATAGLAEVARARGEAAALTLALAALEQRRGPGRHWRGWRRDTSSQWAIPAFVEAVALAHAAQGAWEPAALLFGATAAWAAAVDHTRAPARRERRAAAVAAARAALSRRAAALAWAGGEALTVEQAAAHALAHRARAVPALAE